MSEITTKDLADYNGVLYVTNNTKTRISHDDQQGNRLLLQPAGVEGSWGILSLHVAKHPGFQKLWRRGAVSVSTEPSEEKSFSVDDPEDKIDLSKYLGGAVTMESDPNRNALVQVVCEGCSQMDFVSVEQSKALAGKKFCDIEGSEKGKSCPNKR